MDIIWNKSSKEAIEKMNEQINILKQDLNLKIEENEMTHIQVNNKFRFLN